MGPAKNVHFIPSHSSPFVLNVLNLFCGDERCEGVDYVCRPSTRCSGD